MNHFVTTCEFKVELRFGNAKIGSKLAIFCPLWPWNCTDDIPKSMRHLFYDTSSFMHCFVTISDFKLELVWKLSDWVENQRSFAQFDLLIWQMTLKNNTAPLRCCFKFCVSFRSHWSLQTGVTVQKRPNWGKISFDLCDLDLWHLTLTYCMGITFVNSNNYWQFHDTMTGTLWTRHQRMHVPPP